MKIKLDRIISLATLVAAVVAIVLVLKRPAPVVPQAAPAAVAQQTQSAEPGAQPAEQPSSSAGSFSTPASQGTPVAAPQAATQAAPAAKSDAGSSSDAVSGALAKLFGGGAGLASLSPESNVGAGAPVIKDQQVSMDGDVVHGKFLTEIAGKDVWVTISGHMGEKDGYATFDPTEIKVGNTNIPVALVNPALQRKMAEERDRLKIPNNSGGAQQ